jgi:hypothetical protein
VAVKGRHVEGFMTDHTEPLGQLITTFLEVTAA